MSTKKLITLGIVIVIFVVITTFVKSGNRGSGENHDSSNLIVGNNAIYVAEQAPGNSILVQVVYLEKPGFVVIHEDASESPGKILGASSLLRKGETKNLPAISLSREIKDGETIYAMLHLDNGDSEFDAKNDKPALDPTSGTPVIMIVSVGKDAAEPGAVNL